MTLLEETSMRTQQFVLAHARAERKMYGQFFTPAGTASFMASLFEIPQTAACLRILDAGAGSGILSVALVERLLNEGYSGRIELTCYETDPHILPLLEENLRLLCRKGVRCALLAENYLTSQSFAYEGAPSAGLNTVSYDLVIGNPPYKKISKDAPEALAIPQVCHGAPNLDSLFCAMSIHNLKHGVQLVYIIPRSWTSGAYFELFRRYMLSRCSLCDIHLFDSRNKVFTSERVLQETMIIRLCKGGEPPAEVAVSSSTSSDFAGMAHFSLPYETLVGANGYIYLATDEREASTLARINRMPSSLPANGTPMKTGIIVDFRTRYALRSEASSPHTYPLFYAQHIRKGRVEWPVGKAGEYIHTTHKAHLQANANYLFVKRFTSKEELRRLQCGIYLNEDYPQYPFISTQNKLNFIKCRDKDEAFGLYVLLNSTLYDTYYRILNGSTQVNSTEMNRMPIPHAHIIRQMGKQLQGKPLSQENCDKILEQWTN